MNPFALLAAAVLAVAPPPAVARECDKDIVTICADGFTWDREAGACVESVTG